MDPNTLNDLTTEQLNKMYLELRKKTEEVYQTLRKRLIKQGAQEYLER